MFTSNSGNVATRFTESSPNYAGNKTRAAQQESKQTALRKAAEQSIVNMASAQGKTLDTAVTNILANSTDALAAYVAGKMEVPKKEPVALALQAILLRADDVATVAKALDTDDDDALCEIEAAEQDAIDMNSSETMHIMPPEVAAAVKMGLQYALGKHQSAGGSGTSSALIKDVKNATGVNGYDFNISDLLGSPTGGEIGSPSPGGGWSPDQSQVDYFNGFDIPVPTGGPSITTENVQETTGTGPSIWDTIFGAIDKVVGAVTTVTGAVNTTAGTVTGAVQTVKDQASDIGADSISKAIRDNMPLLIGVVVAIMLTIIIAVYASRRK